MNWKVVLGGGGHKGFGVQCDEMGWSLFVVLGLLVWLIYLIIPLDNVGFFFSIQTLLWNKTVCINVRGILPHKESLLAISFFAENYLTPTLYIDEQCFAFIELLDFPFLKSGSNEFVPHVSNASPIEGCAALFGAMTKSALCSPVSD